MRELRCRLSPHGDFEGAGVGEEEIHEAVVCGVANAAKGDGVPVLDGYLEVISCFQMKLLADDSGQKKLTFLG